MQHHTNCQQCALRDHCIGYAQGTLDVTMTPRLYHAGESIFCQGDECEGLYIVRSGVAKVFQLTGEGDENVTGFHYPGAVMGIEGLADDHHATFAESIGTMSVCFVPRVALLGACAGSPTLLKSLLKVASQSVVQNLRTQRTLGTLSAEQRVASFLLETSQEQSRCGRSATEIELPMRRNDVAKHLALAAETLSRTFKRLETTGVLAVDPNDRHQVSIQSMDQLVARSHAA
ncbi:MAG: CRP/FNR family transcriptional regulator [Gammaproteobacteria bacterium]|jgi:CRP/FNR family transcriptional regulator